MSEDRKYRQHGYREDDRDRDRDRQRTPAPQGPRPERDGPRTPNLMSSHEVFRCARCGRIQAATTGLEDACPQCGVDLHSCVQCQSFDPGATFECRETIPARVRPKDARNECALFVGVTRVEKETGSTPSKSPESSARKAFDDLFK